jgi:hypothetical protein
MLAIPRPFLVSRVDRLLVRDGRAWSVKQGRRWRFCRDLCIQVPVLSIVDPQWGAVLSGVGVVRCLERGELVITA